MAGTTQKELAPGEGKTTRNLDDDRDPPLDVTPTPPPPAGENGPPSRGGDDDL